MRGSYSTSQRPILGVSSCLLGNPVRYNGGHKYNDYIVGTLGKHFDFVPFCPEVAIGLSTPRAPIRLIEEHASGKFRAVRVDDPDQDFTNRLARYADHASTLMDDFCGYIVKQDSPSCGMGAGIYTSQLMQQRPELPIEEEGSLLEPQRRENFIMRVFTLFRWRQMHKAGLTAEGLMEFHTRHKSLVQAHHQVTYQDLERLVANVDNDDLSNLATRYLVTLMQGLRHQGGCPRTG